TGRSRGRDAAGQHRRTCRQADRPVEGQRRTQVTATQLFAFVLHQAGKAADSARELVGAAMRIFPDASPIAIVTGAGAVLEAACRDAAASYREVWKFGSDALAYPNAEIIRPLLLKV